MSSFLKYLVGRIFFAVITTFLISLVMFGIIYMSPLETRLSLFMPSSVPMRILIDEEAFNRLKDRIIEENHLNDSFPIQYGIWAKNSFTNKGGWSPTLQEEVLPALLKRTPATFELTLYSFIMISILTLVSGMYAARFRNQPADYLIRVLSITASAIPLFVLALFLMAIFYINLKWTSLTGLDISLLKSQGGFHAYTGIMTLDGLLNGRMEITLTAFRRLLLPVLTITASQWAVLTRIARNSAIEELQKDYVLAAKARGASNQLILWRHVFKNILGVYLTNTALSAAGIVTGVFIVERIFLWPGVSEILFHTGSFVPDAPAVIGFAIYSVIMVLSIMIILDMTQALVNPAISQSILGGTDVD
jgi:ABC-type dipeptide/oligopeptide/nickel transport system permease component